MPRYQIILEAMPSPIEPAIRLRQLLKVALRGFRLKCVLVVEVNGSENVTEVRTRGGDKEWSRRSDNWIAEQSHVSRTLVEAIRGQVAEKPPEERTRKTPLCQAISKKAVKHV